MVEAVKERVLALVAEKTGYPPDMLDLDLDLEADLGVDTVKQAEMFAAVREAYGIQRDAKSQAARLPTLAHVIGSSTTKRPTCAHGGAEPRPQQGVIRSAANQSARPRHQATIPVRNESWSRRREDRLSARDAGPGPRPRGRSRRRYR